MKILIIDDEEDLCLLLSAMLKRKGHKVTYELTLQSAMQKLKVFSPDLVFLDNNLPDGYGLNYIKKIRAFRPDCEIIFMSAMSNLKYECSEMGVTNFLEKPISFGKIQHLLGPSVAP